MATPNDPGENFIRLHGSVVSVNDKGLLILGPSGSGKTSLAMRLICMGAKLVADDQVELRQGADGPIAQAPLSLRGLLEARFVGILRVPHLVRTQIHLVVDLSEVEADRLPPQRSRELAGFALPLIKASQIDHLAPAIFCYLMGERQD